jgi:TRAP-type C4-dicarboxylate transport system permease small subunit
MSITRLTTGLAKNLDRVAGAIFMLIVFLVVANVILRLQGRPFDSCYELVGLMMALAISFSLAHCAFQGGHVALIFFTERLSPKKQLVLEMTANFIVLFFLVTVVYMMVIYGQRMFNKGHIGMNTKIPLYYFAYSIAFGFFSYCWIIISKQIILIGKMIEK